VATILTFGESPEKEKSYWEIGIREIESLEDKCISAFEIVKSQGRSRAVDLVNDHGPLIVFTVEGLPSDVISGFGESGIQRTRGRLHFNIRNPEIPKGGRTAVIWRSYERRSCGPRA
jgi:hypothetical protein